MASLISRLWILVAEDFQGYNFVYIPVAWWCLHREFALSCLHSPSFWSKLLVCLFFKNWSSLMDLQWKQTCINFPWNKNLALHFILTNNNNNIIPILISLQLCIIKFCFQLSFHLSNSKKNLLWFFRLAKEI